MVAVAGVVTDGADGGQQAEIYDGHDDVYRDLGISSADVEELWHSLV